MPCSTSAVFIMSVKESPPFTCRSLKYMDSYAKLFYRGPVFGMKAITMAKHIRAFMLISICLFLNKCAAVEVITTSQLVHQ